MTRETLETPALVLTCPQQQQSPPATVPPPEIRQDAILYIRAQIFAAARHTPESAPLTVALDQTTSSIVWPTPPEQPSILPCRSATSPAVTLTQHDLTPTVIQYPQ